MIRTIDQVGNKLRSAYVSRMLALTVSYQVAPDSFTDQAHVKPLPTHIKERCSCLLARDPSCQRGLKLMFEHVDERANQLPSSSPSALDWELKVSPAEIAWTTRQFFRSRTKPPSEREALGISSGLGRVRDFLEAIIRNIVPRSSVNQYGDVALGENRNLSRQGETSRSPWHSSNIIFATDFDCTCTLVDTCKILVRAAEVAALKRPEKESLLLWQPGNFHKDYKAAIKRHVERTRVTVQTLFLEHKEKDCEEICSRESEVKSVPDEHHEKQKSDVPVKAIISDKKLTDGVMYGDGKPSPYREAELRMALTKLAMLEIMCNQDVISLGVLRGPTREEIRAEAGVRVRLRTHCPKVLQRLAHTGTAIHVVSANWSRDLIVAGLPKLPENRLFVHSNDLIFDSNGRSVGTINGKMVDAFDKEDLLRALRCTSQWKTLGKARQKFSLQSPWNKKVDGGKTNLRADPILVFVGDSHTDLLGLLEADLGIVIGESLLMRRIMALFGIQLRALAEASSRISVARVSNSMLSYKRSGILFETRSWADVEACLFGDHAEAQPDH